MCNVQQCQIDKTKLITQVKYHKDIFTWYYRSVTCIFNIKLFDQSSRYLFILNQSSEHILVFGFFQLELLVVARTQQHLHKR